MIEHDVAIGTAHGKMPAFAVSPEGPGDFPAIIFFMDAPGIREELRNMARHIARRGYFCVLPDLYYRLGHIRLDVTRRDETLMDVWRALMVHLTNQRVIEDTAAVLAWLDSQERVRPGSVGCVGYCMSGRYVVTAAGRFPRRIAAVGSLYGTGVVTDKDDSPHLLLPDVRAEMYFAFGGADPVIPPADVAKIRAALDDAGSNYTIDVFPEASHGFCFAERAAYDHNATEQSWEKLFALWDRTLKRE